VGAGHLGVAGDRLRSSRRSKCDTQPNPGAAHVNNDSRCDASAYSGCSININVTNTNVTNTNVTAAHGN
jgi:hypothetical protein